MLGECRKKRQGHTGANSILTKFEVVVTQRARCDETHDAAFPKWRHINLNLWGVYTCTSSGTLMLFCTSRWQRSSCIRATPVYRCSLSLSFTATDFIPHVSSILDNITSQASRVSFTMHPLAYHASYSGSYVPFWPSFTPILCQRRVRSTSRSYWTSLGATILRNLFAMIQSDAELSSVK